MDPVAMTQSGRDRLRRDGFLAVPGALGSAEVDRLAGALDRVYADERKRGRVTDGDPLHLLGGIWRDPAIAELVDLPPTFAVIWGELGWNIHVHHCHLDVTPSRTTVSAPSWGWHQDGGRQNLELDGHPRPRLSLKVCFWLSDVSRPDRGNMLVIPGSHVRDTLARPARPELGFEAPAGAAPVLASPGDALIFDRRLWHSRSDNVSALTRKAIFVAYTYRWIRPRDDLEIDRQSARFRRLSPGRRQLLGEHASPWSHWGLERDSVPLRAALARLGLLDPSIPAQR